MPVVRKGQTGQDGLSHNQDPRRQTYMAAALVMTTCVSEIRTRSIRADRHNDAVAVPLVPRQGSLPERTRRRPFAGGSVARRHKHMAWIVVGAPRDRA